MNPAMFITYIPICHDRFIMYHTHP